MTCSLKRKNEKHRTSMFDSVRNCFGSVRSAMKTKVLLWFSFGTKPVSVVNFRKSWFILAPLDSVCTLACSTSDALDSLHHEGLRFITARKHLHTHSSLNSILATPTTSSPAQQKYSSFINNEPTDIHIVFLFQTR